MIELQLDSRMNGTLSSADERDNYFFVVSPNVVTTLTFTALQQEYEITCVKKKHPIDKEGGVAAHSVAPGSLATIRTFVFDEPIAHTVYFIVASANQSTIPGDGYSINLSAE